MKRTKSSPKREPKLPNRIETTVACALLKLATLLGRDIAGALAAGQRCDCYVCGRALDADERSGVMFAIKPDTDEVLFVALHTNCSALTPLYADAPSSERVLQ